jgi:hypothetical protein
MIRAGQLTNRDEHGRVILPNDLAAASIDEVVDIRDDPLMLFFTTWLGASDEAYCGYEYSADAPAVDSDPLQSGEGEAVFVTESWYWICAG